jgi:hypothetical protein
VGKYAAALGIGLSALTLLGFLAYTHLEIYSPERFRPPSREAQVNPYLALDRWLGGAGRSVRVEPQGDPSLVREAPEPVVFIQASFFSWDGGWEGLEPWVAGGGTLILSLDTPWYEREEGELAGVLTALGIAEDRTPDRWAFSAGEEDPDFDPDAAFSLSGAALTEGEAGPGFSLVTDGGGFIRLARLRRGAGTVTVLGKPAFLQSAKLHREPNARLAWELLSPPGGPVPGREGILFIRGRPEFSGLFGRMAKRGNAGPLLCSALVLLALGLWMVIPPFGVLEREEEAPGRSIRERFLAEGRFLQKYRALGPYRDAFVREIRGRLRRREGLEDEARVDRRFCELWEEAAPPGSPPARGLLLAGGALDGESAAGLGTASSGKGPSAAMGRGELVRTVNTLETMLERLL